MRALYYWTVSTGAERQYPRYALEAVVEIAGEDGPLEGRTRNLSRGGLCADIAGAIAPGTAVTVRIALVFDVETASEPLTMPARVVWCTPLSDGHQLGLTFGALDSEKLSNLEMFLRFLEEGRKRGAV